MNFRFSALLFFTLISFLLNARYERPMTVILASYNNSQNYERNLTSLLQQEYSNWNAFYYDDCSPDGTGKLVKKFLEQHDSEDRVQLIQNKKRRGALANQWTGAHATPPDNIIVLLDGDDHLAHPHVLTRINEAYDTSNTYRGQLYPIWTTYGQYQEYPSGKAGACREIPERIIEENRWRELRLPLPVSHVKTFYASLFQALPLSDLMYHNGFYAFAPDIAFFFPILEMAGFHTKFIPEVLYRYYSESPLNEFNVNLKTVLHLSNHIRSLARYTPLKNLPEASTTPDTADLILVLDESYSPLPSGIENIADFTTIKTFNSASYSTPSELKEALIALIQERPSEFIMLGTGHCNIIAPIDAKECVQWMKKTQAYGFFLSLGEKEVENNLDIQYQSPVLELTGTIRAWKFYTTPSLEHLNRVNMTIYKKSQLINQVVDINTNSIQNFMQILMKIDWNNKTEVGLCYRESPICLSKQ